MKKSVLFGSLGGAVAIHLTFMACSSMRSPGDGGDDVVTADAAADSIMADTPGSFDTGVNSDGMSLLDTMQESMAEAARDLIALEVGDANADIDAGPDTGSMCACPTPVPPPVYSFALRVNGRAPYGPGSTAHIDVIQFPPFNAPPGTPDPLSQIVATVNLWVPQGMGTVNTRHITLTCTIITDGAHAVIPPANCTEMVIGSPTSLQAPMATGGTVVTFTDTQIEVHIDSIQMSSDGFFPTFTNLVFRASDPNGHYVTPLSAYVP